MGYFLTRMLLSVMNVNCKVYPILGVAQRMETYGEGTKWGIWDTFKRTQNAEYYILNWIGLV